MPDRTWAGMAVLAFVVGVSILGEARVKLRADLIKLNSGGVLRGEITESSGDFKTGEMTIRNLSGAVVVVNRENTEYVNRRTVASEEFEFRVRFTAKDSDSLWALAQWCKEKRLGSQRDHVLEMMIELDPDHEEARQALGHVLNDGQWMTQDELMRARGYVQYKGRFMTPQERDLLQQTEKEREKERAWHKHVRLWHGWITGRDDDRRRRGLANLRSIRDPYAVHALNWHLSDDENAGVRRLLVSILSQIPSRKTVKPLVDVSLFDTELEVRTAALNSIAPDQFELATTFYVHELKNDLNTVVRRAARALQQVGGKEAVPILIDALVTTHRYRVQVPANDGISIGTDGSFANNRIPLPPNIEAGLLAGQYPNGVIVLPPRHSIQRTRIVNVTRQHENREVLAALQHLTGKSFGYNERVWRRWWASTKDVIDQPAS